MSTEKDFDVISRTERERDMGYRTPKLLERNYNPKLHLFGREREYVRAVNAVKLDKVFAQPFVHNFDGHPDSVYSMASPYKRLNIVLSGCCAGMLKAWNLSNRTEAWSVKAHEGFVHDLSVDSSGIRVFSCGSDAKVRIWHADALKKKITKYRQNEVEPLETYTGEHQYRSVSCQYSSEKSQTSDQSPTQVFVSCGQQVDLWDTSRKSPMQSYKWVESTLVKVRFNPSEYDVFATCAVDRTLILYDIRQKTEITKVTMAMASNDICWNPQSPYDFVVANEDSNLYMFDLRYIKEKKAKKVYEGHSRAVMSVDIDPTGRKIVSGSYDKTLRIWETYSGKARDCYYHRRMNRVFVTKYTKDSKFVLSGSDDCNVRLWKSEASRSLKKLTYAEQQSLEYKDALKKKFKDVGEVKRIQDNIHLPKPVFSRLKMRRHMKKRKKVRMEREKRFFLVRGKKKKAFENATKGKKKDSILDVN